MEKLESRILIEHVNGGVIAYLYNRESFNLLDIEKQSFDNSQFVEIGQIIEYEGKKYRIENINFKMDERLNYMEHGAGTNIYSPTEPTNFNCQIGMFVKDFK